MAISELPAAPVWSTSDGTIFRDRAAAEKHEVACQLRDFMLRLSLAKGWPTAWLDEIVEGLQAAFLIALRPER